MLSISEIKEKASLISSPLPIFWIAQYRDGYDTLKIPKCNKCNNYAKVFDYKNIVCQANLSGTMCGEKYDFSWDVFELQNNLFFEYDEFGKELISFKYLPQDRLVAFYIYIKPKDEIVGFNLQNGEFNINGTTLGTGVVLDRQLLAVSSQREYYGRELFHFRSCLSKGTKEENLLWYKVGYTCELLYAKTSIIIAIHVPTLNPYVFSECYPKTK